MSNPAWHDFWEEKEEALRAFTGQKGHTVQDGLSDEDTFLSEFEGFCTRSKVPSRGRRLQLFHKFRDSCGSIIKISQGISGPGPDNGRPESLIWKTSLAALEVSTFASRMTFLTIL